MSGNATSKESATLTCLVVGAGSRGNAYSRYAALFPQQMKVVGVAEPSEARRNAMLKLGTVKKEYIFTDWKDAAKQEKFADFVIIATTDRYHKEPAVAFARLGYHILLEKPMAVTEEDCREIVSVCRERNVTLAVCHVLRYTPWVIKIKEIIESGEIGDVVSIRHTEPVGFWHFAHSFVRGNWHNEATSTFSLMAKSCHDIDLINHWMMPRKCVSVSSFGKLSHFTKKDKPPNATARCLDCPEEPNCPYSAKRLYLGAVKQGHTGWPVKVITDVVDIENVTEALRTGPYGKCVYDTDNDVVSHQVVNFQYDDGATACFNMVAFTKRLCAREVKVYGTRGEIAFEDGWNDIEVFDFLTETTKKHSIHNEHPVMMGGHGGADFHLMKSFIETLRGDDLRTAVICNSISCRTLDFTHVSHKLYAYSYMDSWIFCREGEGGKIVTGPVETLNSHLLVFAAEKARLENRVVTINPDGTF